MGRIALVRIDSRLIHGQVVAKWIRQINANGIVVMDDELSQDPFLKRVYAMAAPPGTPVNIMSVAAFVERWNKDQFGNRTLLVICRSVASARYAYENGFPLENLQVGGLGGGSGRVNVYQNITLDEKDVEDLEFLQKGGVKIIFQTIPEDTPASFDSVKGKVFE